MVDREMCADSCSRMYVNTGFAMCHFGDDTRNERHAEYQQLMRYAVVTDGADGGIATDNLAERMGGRVTVVSGFDVGCQYAA